MIEIQCTRCGGDCSHAYGTYMGYPFHIGCLPLSPNDMPFWAQPDLGEMNEDAHQD